MPRRPSTSRMLSPRSSPIGRSVLVSGSMILNTALALVAEEVSGNVLERGGAGLLGESGL